MSLLEDLRGRIAAARVAYQASYERTLGRDVWAKILERRLCFPPEYNPGLKRAIDRSAELSPDAWHQFVGRVARDCPRSMPKNLRLRWVVKHLDGGRAC